MPTLSAARREALTIISEAPPLGLEVVDLWSGGWCRIRVKTPQDGPRITSATYQWLKEQELIVEKRYGRSSTVGKERNRRYATITDAGRAALAATAVCRTPAVSAGDRLAPRNGPLGSRIVGVTITTTHEGRGELAAAVDKARRFTSYRTHTWEAGAAMATGTTGTLTVAEATDLARACFAERDGLRTVQAEPNGAITFRQGTRRIRLQPGHDSQPKHLTARQAEDLVLIAQADTAAEIRYTQRQGYVIVCGAHGTIPPAATEKLIERGWIATSGDERAPVTVSLAGTVALAWRHACKEDRATGSQVAEQIAETVHDVYRPEPADD